MKSINISYNDKNILKGISLIFFLLFVNGIYKESLFTYSQSLFWLSDFFNFVIVPISLSIYFYKQYNLKPTDYGLIKPNRGYPLSEIIGASIFTAFSLGCIYALVDYMAHGYLNDFFGYIPPSFSYSTAIPSGLLKLPVVIYLAITAALVEETVFRGIPYKLMSIYLNTKNKDLIFISITSLAFALIHWEDGYGSFLSAFVFGLLAAKLYLFYKNLWPLIGAHFLVDMYSFW